MKQWLLEQFIHLKFDDRYSKVNAFNNSLIAKAACQDGRYSMHFSMMPMYSFKILKAIFKVHAEVVK